MSTEVNVASKRKTSKTRIFDILNVAATTGWFVFSETLLAWMQGDVHMDSVRWALLAVIGVLSAYVWYAMWRLRDIH
jgi:hypothetical protein